ncbi:unnamed protein product [Bemisia tabaci]|uniref:AAA-ATPase-like domain-containing protein n=1 Tax=Bemisia tabaci TaxID=7038 RepID=A0A9P0F2H4_BEMTA|nr:unnamed protein product [Bemisia tabaci]
MILQLLSLIISASEASNTGEEQRKYTTFKDLTKTREFIDKSLLIKFILDNHWHIYIEAPPGFGKTANLQMLRDFFALDVNSHGYSINAAEILKTDETFQNIGKRRKGLRNTLAKRVSFVSNTDSQSVPVSENVTKTFSVSTKSLRNYDTFSKPPLRILQESPELFETQFARYPVLFIDFGNMSTKSYQDYIRTFKVMVSKLFDQFKYLLKSNRLSRSNKDEYLLFRDQVTGLSMNEVTLGGVKLAGLLSAHHHRKAIVLIDNFDVPIREALLAPHLDIESYREIAWSVSRMVKGLTESRFVHRTIVTGCLRIEIADGLMHFHIFEDESLHRYYGLTDYDVLELAKRSNGQKNIAHVRNWYGGYKTASKGHDIYNTRSTISYFKTGVLKPYRFESIKFKTLKTLLAFRKLGRDVEEAFDDKTRLCIREKISWRRFRRLRRTIFSSNQTVLHRSLFLQILLDHGFYTIQDGNRLHVPNFEAMLDIKNLIFDRGYYIDKLNIPDQTIDSFVQSIDRLSGEDTSFHNFFGAVTELFKNRIPRGARELAHTLVTLVADARKFSLLRGQETPESGRQDVLVKRSTEIGIVIGILVGSINEETLKPVYHKSLQVFPDCKFRVAILLGLKPQGAAGDLDILYAFDNRTVVDSSTYRYESRVTTLAATIIEKTGGRP